jgi:hypothetical protein
MINEDRPMFLAFQVSLLLPGAGGKTCILHAVTMG